MIEIKTPSFPKNVETLNKFLHDWIYDTMDLKMKTSCCIIFSFDYARRKLEPLSLKVSIKWRNRKSSQIKLKLVAVENNFSCFCNCRDTILQRLQLSTPVTICDDVSVMYNDDVTHCHNNIINIINWNERRISNDRNFWNEPKYLLIQKTVTVSEDWRTLTNLYVERKSCGLCQHLRIEIASVNRFFISL